MYDITDIDSFIKVKKWVKELHSMVGQKIAIVICANKTDLEKLRVVDNNEAETFIFFEYLSHILYTFIVFYFIYS